MVLDHAGQLLKKLALRARQKILGLKMSASGRYYNFLHVPQSISYYFPSGRIPNLPL